jgi:predicted transcriptional regulator
MQKQQQHRDRYDILRNILTIVGNTRPLYRNHTNKTRIGYTAGLTHTQTVEYLGMLLDSGLLVMTEFKPFFSYYEITERGRRCLQLLDDLEDDMRSSPNP